MENPIVKYIAELIQRTKSDELRWIKRSLSTYSVDINKDSKKARIIIQRVDVGRDNPEMQFRVFDMSNRNKIMDLSSSERFDLRAPLTILFQAVKDGEDRRGADFLKSVLS